MAMSDKRKRQIRLATFLQLDSPDIIVKRELAHNLRCISGGTMRAIMFILGMGFELRWIRIKRLWSRLVLRRELDPQVFDDDDF